MSTKPAKASEDLRSISIIGLTGSGKSTYLLLLPKAMISRRGWTITPLGDTFRHSSNDYQRLVEGGQYPEHTQPGNVRVDRYRCTKKRFGGRRKQVLLQIPDVAGDDTDPNKSTIDFYERFAQTSSGIMILIDATSSENQRSQYEVFFRNMLLGKLGQVVESRKHLPLAVNLTKCDERAECRKSGKEGFSEAIQKLPEIIGRTAFNYLDNFSKRKAVELGVFACSSTGFLRNNDGKYLKENGVYVPQRKPDDSIRDPQNIYPERVTDAFVWLLKRVR